MSKRYHFDDEVDKIGKALSLMKDKFLSEDDASNYNEWLRLLYQSYLSIFLEDNNRIWTTGAILVPISLAGFAAFMGLNNPKWFQVTVLMIASCSLYFVWLVIAENHRAFQEKAEAWMVAIQRTLELKETGALKLRGNRLNRVLTWRTAIQKTRWGLFFLVVIMWIFLLVIVVRNC